MHEVSPPTPAEEAGVSQHQHPSPSPPERAGVSPERYQRIVIVATALLALIILTGAAVRLTGSGLGCEDWPKCSEDRLVPEWSFHAWIEFGNRLLSGVVGFGVGAAVLFAYRRTPRRPDLIRWAWGLVAGVVAQILLGGATVLVDLHPLFVAAHYLLSIVLLWNALVLLDKNRSEPGRSVPIVDATTAMLGRVTVGWLVVVLTVGTLVTGTGPHSGDPDVARLPLDLDRIIQIHSVTAWICVALVLTLVMRLQRTQHAHLARLAQFTLMALVAQGSVGYWQFFTGVPALLVELHIFGSVAVFLTLLWTHLSMFHRAPQSVPAPDHELVESLGQR